MNDSDELNLGPRKKEARNLAKKLIKDSGIKEAPVSLQKIIEHIQKDVDLQVKGEHFGNEVSGLLVRCKDSDGEFVTIGYNQDHPWCRRRFTIAHEIGHLLFGHSCTDKTLKSDSERECDVFASELLIPTDFIKRDFPLIKKVPELSKMYRVSGEAMSIKIGETGLLK